MLSHHLSVSRLTHSVICLNRELRSVRSGYNKSFLHCVKVLAFLFITVNSGTQNVFGVYCHQTT